LLTLPREPELKLMPPRGYRDALLYTYRLLFVDIVFRLRHKDRIKTWSQARRELPRRAKGREKHLS